jgi:hypothetical protein
MTHGPEARKHFLAFLLLSSSVVLASARALPIGPLEEHFLLGQRLHEEGSLGARLLRPPGYPAFVAATLWARDGLRATGLLPGPLQRDEVTVTLVQRLALLLVSCVVFREALRLTTAFGAFCLATLLSVNPLSLILAGTLSYPLLDMLLVALGTTLLARATGADRWRPLLLAGVLWGLAALVRPVALALPAFALVAALWRRPGSWRPGLRAGAGLAMGMAAMVGPYALRNLALTGRLVPVCAQAGFALWGSSVARPLPGESYVGWVRIWREKGMPLFAEVTGSPEYSIDRLTEHALRLDAAFGRAARANIERDPGTYLSNVANNLLRLPLDTSGWWWQRFLWVNAGQPLSGDEPAPPDARARSRIALADAFMLVLNLAGLAGILIGLARSDPWAEPILVVYAVLWLGNAFTFAASRYAYARLPLSILALGILLRLPGAAASRASSLLAGALVALALGATAGLILWHP